MNLLDYLATEFSRFDEKPFSELDAAVFTQLAMVRVELPALSSCCYALDEQGRLVPGSSADKTSQSETDSEDLQLHIELRDLLCAEHFPSLFTGLAAQHVKECLIAAAMNPRYREVAITGYQTVLDAARQTQFSATTFSCDEFTFVAFRGTDVSKTGWREDFNLSYMNPVPAQTLGLQYVVHAVGQSTSRPLYIGGHSKGGNIAEYIALVADGKLRANLCKAYSFDGPGFKRDAFSEADFKTAGELFVKYVPQDSVIGMILDSQSAYRVVKSSEIGAMQHDLFSWEICDDSFVAKPSLTAASVAIDNAVEQWVHSYSEAELRLFIDALFDTLGEDDADDLGALFAGGTKTIAYLYEVASKADSQRAEVLKRFAKDLADALSVSVADQANDRIKAVRGQVEDTFNQILAGKLKK